MDDKYIKGLQSAEKMRVALKAVESMFPLHSITIMVGPFNQDKSVFNYVSNSEREDIIVCLEETAKRLKNNQDFQTPETN